MASERRQTTQTIAWFWDLFKRGLLELDPPYQRRSVWSQSYKNYFVDTILLDYPAPAVFLYEDIDEDGVAVYSVVDGKQRLSTIFEFLNGNFPVSDSATTKRFQGLSFSDLPSEAKKKLFGYQFAIEFLPTTDEATLSNIFDRINRNVARLTAQELRHAKYSGVFATRVEELSDLLDYQLPKDFPRIAPASKRQMKDVELVAQLLLLTERGIESYSQGDLDNAYSLRDEEWDEESIVDEEFRQTVKAISLWAEGILASDARRLKNQADFYSLYAATLDLHRKNALPETNLAINRLADFFQVVKSEDTRQGDPLAKRYFEAARSASNDLAQRRERVGILTEILTGTARTQ